MSKRSLYFLFIAPVLLFFVYHFVQAPAFVDALYPALFQDQVLIIDPGHGGEDGGAVSLTGALESHINLAVSKRLDGILGLYGVRSVLLREEDISLHDATAQTLRQKKASDLHNRVAMIGAQPHAVLLSIHQNSYPDGRYSGAQVFFAPTQHSRELAQTMQETLRILNPNNNRVEKQIPDTIYLMNHISCPGILVECGFLTNPKEEQLLCSGKYQTKLAAALAGGYLQSVTQGEREP